MIYYKNTIYNMIGKYKIFLSHSTLKYPETGINELSDGPYTCLRSI